MAGRALNEPDVFLMNAAQVIRGLMDHDAESRSLWSFWIGIICKLLGRRRKIYFGGWEIISLSFADKAQAPCHLWLLLIFAM